MANSTPLATQSKRPNAPFIRGSSNPRNSNSSPRAVLNTNKATMTANQTQLPDMNATPASDCIKTAESWLATGGITPRTGIAPSAAKSSTNGMRTSQSRPPTRPVLGLRGDCSHRASLRTDQRSEPRSRYTSTITSANCQIRPTVRPTRRARDRGTGPSSWAATNGATTQASAPIGSAAAAQMPTIFAREYCSLSFSLGGPSTVDSPETPRAICPSALIFIDPPSETSLLPRLGCLLAGHSRGSPPFVLD